jgi:uncharacterized protein
MFRSDTTTPDASTFLHGLFAALDHDGLDVSDMVLDHLCYRVASPERFAWMREALAQQGTLLSESLIGGRAIATFRLHLPIRHGERSIDVIELPAPKPTSHYPEGYEHAEFVVGEDLSDLIKRHPMLPWDTRGMHKPTNAEVRLRYPGFSVKFHRRSLAEVIDEELRDQRRVNERS